MPTFPPGQRFLVTVTALSTTDDFDCVGVWSAVFEAEDLPKLDVSTAAEAAMLPLRQLPPDVTARPMNDEEIKYWRDNQ